jgi:lipopolysaccharide/colanic/teichoic acid biosynthesis glycosyltransferase
MPKIGVSLVGLYPEKLHFVAELQTTITYYFQRLTVNRGGVGWAQVRYGYGVTVEDALESL